MKVQMSNNPWWLLLIFVLSILLAGFVYLYKKDERFSSRLNYVLFGLRALVIFVLFLLFLGISFKSVSTREEEPQLAVLIDRSKSMAFLDSGVQAKGETILRELGKLSRYKTRAYGFTDSLEGELNLDSLIQYNGLNTGIKKSLDQLELMYSDRNLSSVLVFSDGINNVNNNNTSVLSFPTYCVGLTNGAGVKDVSIQRINHPRSTRKGNVITINAQGSSLGFQGKELNYLLLLNEDTVQQKKIGLQADRQSLDFSFKLKLDSAGVQKVTIKATELDGESIVSNNTMSGFVEVNEKKSVIDFVYDVAHPDVGYVSRVLERSSDYKVRKRTIAEFLNTDLKDGFIVIRLEGDNELLQEELESKLDGFKGSVVFLKPLRSQTANKNTVLTCASFRVLEDSYLSYNKRFNLFDINQRFIDFQADMPPLKVGATAYTLSKGARVIAFQNRKGFDTGFPLIAYAGSAVKKTLVLAGEGWWRMALSQAVEDRVVDEFVMQLFSFMHYSAKQDLAYLDCKSSIEEGENLRLQMRIFDESGQELDVGVVKVLVTDDNNLVKEYEMLRTSSEWALSVGGLSAGVFELKVDLSGFGLSPIQKEVVVRPSVTEAVNLEFNESYLKELSKSSNGKYYPYRDLNLLIDELNQKQLPVVVHEDTFTRYLREFKWLLLLLLLLMSLEWMLRKLNGHV